MDILVLIFMEDAWRCIITTAVLSTLGCHSVTMDLAVMLPTWHANSWVTQELLHTIELEV